MRVIHDAVLLRQTGENGVNVSVTVASTVATCNATENTRPDIVRPEETASLTATSEEAFAPCHTIRAGYGEVVGA